MARGEFRGGALRRANPTTIQDKVLVGYQGWFTCAGDGEPIGPGHHGWLHWFNTPIPAGGRPNTDLWPDVSDYDPSELYPAPGLATHSGGPVHLFSSRHPKTVRRHFHWMALHGVDGAFLQRFATQCEIKSGNHGIRDLRDEIGERVREAAEAEGRVFAIMYDVSGVPPEKVQAILEQDWMHLLHDQHLLDSPSYLRENGRPVVALWGFGFNGRNHTPELVRAITEFFRLSTHDGVYLVAGTPGHWRTSSSDADRNPGFVQVWTECFDAISPWTVGRYTNEEGADRWGEQRVKADADYLKKLGEAGGRKVDYMPVVFPGGSGFNLSQGKWGMNDMRRNGGQFLWRQIYNAQRAGVRTIYGAMWDEYDEGTVFMPVVPHSSQVPVHPSFRFIALDVDGHDLPSDWYMRIAGLAAEAFHGERTLPDAFPDRELQDYWVTRPRRMGGDEEPQDVDEIARALREWEISGNAVDGPGDMPPPYSLEDTAAPRGRQGEWSQQTPALAGGSGRGGQPPVPQGTRPSPSHHSSLPAAVYAAAAVAGALPARHASAGPRHTPSGLPPPINLSSHPSLSTTRHHPPGGPAMPIPLPLPHRPTSPPRPPPRHPSQTSVARHHARVYHAPDPDLSPVGPSLSSSSSSSSSPSSHASAFPGGGAGLHQARFEGGGAHGPHGPSHSHSVGHGHGHGRGALSHSGSVGSAHGYYQQQQHHQQAGYGQGGYDRTGSFPYPQYVQQQQQQQQGHGFPPHLSSSPSLHYASPHYASYEPGAGAGAGAGAEAGVGGIQGTFASALQAVEGVAGRQARRQLERTVTAWTNKGNTWMNKLK